MTAVLAKSLLRLHPCNPHVQIPVHSTLPPLSGSAKTERVKPSGLCLSSAYRLHGFTHDFLGARAFLVAAKDILVTAQAILVAMDGVMDMRVARLS
jgi:hypothetical protein